MKCVQKIETSDGVLHDTERKAVSHANNRYGLALTSLARRAVQIDKYMNMAEFIDANLGEFARLLSLKDDITLDNDESSE